MFTSGRLYFWVLTVYEIYIYIYLKTEAEYLLLLRFCWATSVIPSYFFFFFFYFLFFPLSLPQIQLGLSIFSVSLFSINCAFSVSFLVLMFALKFLLLNKSDWKCRTIENSLLWQKVSDDNYFWSNLESRFVSISHNCSINMVLFHFHSVYYI